MGPKTTKWVIAMFIASMLYIVYELLIGLITPETSESARSLIEFVIYLWVFFGSLTYWKWLKLLKKFKWNPNTETWDQVFEEPR